MNKPSLTEIMTNPDTQSLHALYVACSGMDIRFTMHHSFAWERFTFEGFTGSDVKLVCAYLRAELAKPGTKFKSSTLGFRRLIEDLPRFADDLATAKAVAAKHRPVTNKARVLAATGRVEKTPEKSALSAGQIIEKHQEMALLLKQWRVENP